MAIKLKDFYFCSKEILRNPTAYITAYIDWSCERNIILYLVLPHANLTLQYWNGQTGHYDGPSNMSYNEMVFILSSYYRQLS